jgi:acyl carrier protein
MERGGEMKREEILTTLLKIGKEVVPELRNGEVDINKSYRELGVNSLDLLEILSAAMKELKVKVPSAQLSSVNSINGLVDLFVKASG